MCGVLLKNQKNCEYNYCNIFDISIKKSKSKHLGFHDTIKEAFNTYKAFKEKEIKRVADLYKDRIPYKLYLALYNYTVEITD